MSAVDVLAVMADNARWAGQVSEHGGVPNRVREAAKGVEARGIEARTAVAELIRTMGEILARVEFDCSEDAVAFVELTATAALARCRGEGA